MKTFIFFLQLYRNIITYLTLLLPIFPSHFFNPILLSNFNLFFSQFFSRIFRSTALKRTIELIVLFKSWLKKWHATIKLLIIIWLLNWFQIGLKIFLFLWAIIIRCNQSMIILKIPSRIGLRLYILINKWCLANTLNIIAYLSAE